MGSNDNQDRHSGGHRPQTARTPPDVPPPIPLHNQDSSELRSPWWSAERAPDQQPSTSTKKGTTRFMMFTRKVDAMWREQCVLISHGQRSARTGKDADLAKTSAASQISASLASANNCRMVCLLQESDQRRQVKQKDTNVWNPLVGYWLVVTTTPAGCREHLTAKDICKRNSADYYTIELGDQLHQSGQDITRLWTRALAPVGEMSQRYVESWRDGSQIAFFSRFWESTQRGDAFHLLHSGMKRLVENSFGGRSNGKDK